jgi:BR serine/threonine kinase
METIGNYELLDTLGVGSQGKVRKAIHQNAQKIVAIKIVKKSDFITHHGLESTLEREVALMRVLNHPHILKLLDVIHTNSKLYLILEYMERGELYDHLVESGALYVPGALRIFRQIIYGLEFLHEQGICHRDMKLENLLVDENYNVKISDFGLARWTKDSMVNAMCGSLHYMAPEVTIGEWYDGKAADVWSTGVILYALLVGRFPFIENGRDETIGRIKSGTFSIPSNVPGEVQDLIKRMLTVDSTQRIGIKEIREHPSFRLFVPEDFVLPRPVGEPWILEPIDVSNVDPQLIEILKYIGFQDDIELKRQLNAKVHTNAKRFLFLMLRRFNFECLPWLGEDDPAVVSLGVKIGSLLSFGDEEGFWGGIEVFRTEVIRNVARIYENLIVIIQKHLTDCGYKWFFPNDVILMARCELDGTDLLIKIAFSGYDKMNVEFGLASGDDMGFASFVDSLSRRIA